MILRGRYFQNVSYVDLGAGKSLVLDNNIIHYQ